MPRRGRCVFTHLINKRIISHGKDEEGGEGEDEEKEGKKEEKTEEKTKKVKAIIPLYF